MTQIWIETDECSELLDCCRFVQMYAEQETWDTDKLRWLVIGSVQSLQIALSMALCTQDTSQSALYRSAQKKYRWLSNPDSTPPNTKLAEPKILLERAVELGLTADYVKKAEELDQLFGLRNNFVHFGCKSWLIDVSGVPILILKCWKLIEHLPKSIHLTDDQSSGIVFAIRSIIEVFESEEVEA